MWWLAITHAMGFAPENLPPDALRELVGDGQVVWVDEAADGSLALVTGGTFVRAPPERVWQEVTNYSAYPAWMPQVSTTVVTPGPDETVDVAWTLDFHFSVISKTVQYTLRYLRESPSRLSWSLVEGDFKEASGAWTVVPVTGGSVAFYATITDLDSMGWMVRQIIKEQPPMEVAIQASTAVTVVRALEERLGG